MEDYMYVRDFILKIFFLSFLHVLLRRNWIYLVYFIMLHEKEVEKNLKSLKGKEKEV